MCKCVCKEIASTFIKYIPSCFNKLLAHQIWIVSLQFLKIGYLLIDIYFRLRFGLVITVNT